MRTAEDLLAEYPGLTDADTKKQYRGLLRKLGRSVNELKGGQASEATVARAAGETATPRKVRVTPSDTISEPAMKAIRSASKGHRAAKWHPMTEAGLNDVVAELVANHGLDLMPYDTLVSSQVRAYSLQMEAHHTAVDLITLFNSRFAKMPTWFTVDQPRGSGDGPHVWLGPVPEVAQTGTKRIR